MKVDASVGVFVAGIFRPAFESARHTPRPLWKILLLWSGVLKLPATSVGCGGGDHRLARQGPRANPLLQLCAPPPPRSLSHCSLLLPPPLHTAAPTTPTPTHTHTAMRFAFARRIFERTPGIPCACTLHGAACDRRVTNVIFGILLCRCDCWVHYDCARKWAVASGARRPLHLPCGCNITDQGDEFWRDHNGLF